VPQAIRRAGSGVKASAVLGGAGRCGAADLFAMKAHFGRCAPWTDVACCADFTQDGCINLADLFSLKESFGTSGYSPSTGNQDCP
jgi:hypothetical protein